MIAWFLLRHLRIETRLGKTMKDISKLWQNQTESVFTTMSREALKHNAINLAQGFPDFDGPKVIKDRAISSISDGKNQYAPSPGLPELRALLSKFQEKKYGLSWDPDSEVTVLSGATEGLFCSIQALCNPGDEMIAFEPFYDSYLPGALTSGATLKTVRLRAPDWTWDMEDLEALVTDKTKALILNTPHNPTGKVFSLEEVKKISEFIIRHDLYLVTDEVYEELVYDEHRHLSMAAMPDMRSRTITVSSTSKTFSFTGWKLGYTFASPELSQAIRNIHQNTVFCSATPLQHGILSGPQPGDSYYQQLRTDYRERRDLLMEILSKAGFKATKPGGSYFIVADYSDLSDLKDREFALWLTREAGVACIPVSPFCINQEETAEKTRLVRFGFCKSKQTLQEAENRLNRHFKS